MRLVFDADKPIFCQLGDLTLDDVIDLGHTVKKLSDCHLWDPYFYEGKVFGDLYLWDEVITYEYVEDNDIEYHELDLDPFLTNFVHYDKEFNIFVDLLEILFSDIRSVADVFDRLVDVNNAPEIFLPKLSALLAYNYHYEFPDDVNRDIIKRLLWIYEGKATDTDILEAADFGNNDKWVGRTFFAPDAEIPDRVATLEYPVNHLFTHDVSTHSELDRFQDSTRYRDGVIIINLLELTDKVKQALRRVVPAGIKIFFNIVSDFSSDDDGNESETGRPGILVFGAWFKYLVRDYYIDYFIKVSEDEGSGSSVFDGDLDYYDHVFSGVQVFFHNFDLQFTDVASYIPIYIKDYFANLTLDYVPEPVPEDFEKPEIEPTKTLKELEAVNPPTPKFSLLEEISKAQNLFNSAYVSDSEDMVPLGCQWTTSDKADLLREAIEEATRGFYNLSNVDDETEISDLIESLKDDEETFRSSLNISETEPTTLESLNIDFSLDASSYNEVQGNKVVQRSDAALMTESAIDALSGLFSIDDPIYLLNGSRWLHTDDYEFLSDLIESVKKDILSEEITQKELDEDCKKLKDAIKSIKDKIQTYNDYFTPDDSTKSKLSVDLEFNGEALSGEKLPPDTTKLDELIEQASELLLSVVASTSSNGLEPGTKWVNPATYSSFNEKIIESVIVSKEVEDQEVVDAQYESLKRWIELFKSSINTAIVIQTPVVPKPSDVFLAPEELDAYNTTFAYNGSCYDEEEGPKILYTAPLEQLIEEAKSLLASVFGTDAPDYYGYDGMQWVPEAVYDAFESLIEEVEGLIDTATEQDEINDGFDRLQKGMEEFAGQIQTYVAEVLNLGSYRLDQLLKIGETIKPLGEYKLDDYTDWRYFRDIDFNTTDVFDSKKVSPISIPNYWLELPKYPEFKFSPYTENPIHNIDYEAPDFEANILYDGLPMRSVNAGYDEKYRYGGDNNVLEQTYPIEDVIPTDDYYPVSAIEDLYVNQWIGDSRVAVNYDGVHTAVDGYYLYIEQFKENDLVDVNGKAVKFSSLSEDQISELSENGMLKYTLTNDFYLDYTDPIEVVTEA